jgi:hypothetical protein
LADKKVEESIVIIIAPGTTKEMSGVSRNRACRDPGEGASPGVPIEKVHLLGLLSSISNEEVEESVVVIITPGAAAGVTTVIDNGSRGDFRKCPVAIVPIEEIVSIDVRDK